MTPNEKFMAMLNCMVGGERAEYSEDGMDGTYKGASIHINPTTNGDYRVKVYSRGGDCILSTYTGSLTRAHTLAEEIIDEVGEVKS